MQFSVGDKVLFGRGRGEKTLAEVIKVNRVSVKVKTLESRGTQRNYPVGTIWKVHPSLCEPVSGDRAPTSTASRSVPSRQTTSPRQILAEKGIQAGDIVEFTFKRSTMQGRIRSINTKSVTITQVTDSRYPNGVYCRPQNISHKVASPSSHKKARHNVGDSVGYDVSGKPYTGVVTKVNILEGTYEVYGSQPFGVFSRVIPAGKICAISKRSDEAIIRDCGSAYASLSPENLTCDGEASRTHVRRRSAELNRALRALFSEIGREVTEEETYAV
jgi:hypothetical protein